MSATNHTSNYNLPIYEAGNRASWLVDFNGAMSTIDSAMNENKLAGDTLKTDMNELQTEFQQVSTKANDAEQAATQASTNAANAVTIANNASTMAGDAKTDAHAALTLLENLTIDSDMNVIHTSENSIFARLTILTTPIGIIFLGGLWIEYPYTAASEWIEFTNDGTNALYFNGTNIMQPLKKHSLIPNNAIYPTVIFYANTLGLNSINIPANGLGAGNVSYGIYLKSDTEAFFCILLATSTLAFSWYFPMNAFSPRRPILTPLPLLPAKSRDAFTPELYRMYTLTA